MTPPVRLFTPRQHELAWARNESAGFVGRGECRSARDHNATSRQINSREDAERERAQHLAVHIRESCGPCGNAARQLLQSLERVTELDSLQDDQREANDADLERDDAWWGQVIEISEAQLRAREREGELIGVDVMEA